MILFIMQVICVMLNSFAAGWCFMENDFTWAIGNTCIALINAIGIVINYFRKKVNQ